MERYMCSTCLQPIERGMAHHCGQQHHNTPVWVGNTLQPKAAGVFSAQAANTPTPSQGTGVRYDQGKGRISLLPGRAIELVMQVGEFGSKKYGDHNYRGGMPVTKYLDAAYRHAFVQWLFKGEDNDQESGLPHLAHAAWNVLAALEQMLLKPELDNRYGKEQGK